MAIAASWCVAAPQLDFQVPKSPSDAKAPGAMSDLALRLIPVYEERDPDRYLANLSALQMLAGDYAAANVSRQSLLDRRRKADLNRPIGRSILFDLYANARAMETENHVSFAEAFSKSFRDVVPRLSAVDDYAVAAWLKTSPAVYRDALQKSLDQLRGKDSIDQAEAVALAWAYISYDAYRSFGPLINSLDAEDDEQRYTTDNDVLIKTPDGAMLSAVIVRPKAAAKTLPTLLEFTLLDSANYAKECAAHGYVGVIAYSRGTRTVPRSVVPYQRDGDDARAVINWIAKQSWSDGRVAMYGEGYSGFTAWAAATRMPAALKAIASSAAGTPGIDVPMMGNIFHNSAYRWSLHVTRPSDAANDGYTDEATWQALNRKWYENGGPYRTMGTLHGQPNPIFIRWLNHPSYDRYWQRMVPYRAQFAHISIPVLTMTGYFAASEPGALYYFNQHTHYDPSADHTLVIGPYDDNLMQRSVAPLLHGYEVDAAALIDLHELRYQWFDHVLKGAAAPAILTDRVNYEVMGANQWRHAPSVDAMAGTSLRFYLDGGASHDSHRLTRRKASNAAYVRQSVNLADRSDASWTPSGELVSKDVESHNGLVFVSDALAKPMEFSGAFAGRLEFVVNKMDLDLNISLYERLANGDNIRLFAPELEFRASYVQDRVHRHLLKAGERENLTFTSEKMASRMLQAGSRLVMVLGVNKRPDREINYGTGADVSEESVADAKVPVKIRWYNNSFIEIPIRK